MTTSTSESDEPGDELGTISAARVLAIALGRGVEPDSAAAPDPHDRPDGGDDHERRT